MYLRFDFADFQQDQNRAKLIRRRSKISSKVYELQNLSVRASEKERLRRQYVSELESIGASLESMQAKAISPDIQFGYEVLASSPNSAIYLSSGTECQAGMVSISGKKSNFEFGVPYESWVHLAFSATKDAITLFVNGNRHGKIRGGFLLPLQHIGSKESSLYGYVQVR